MINSQDITVLLSTAEELCNKFDYVQTKKILDKIAPMLQDQKDSAIIYKFYLFSGICDYERHNFLSAIQCLLKCLQTIGENSSNDRLLSKHTVMHELSLCYSAIFQQTKQADDLMISIDYCKQALNECIDYSLIKKRTGLMEYYIESPEKYLSELVHLAVLYQSKKDYEKSNDLLDIAMVCCKRHYDWRTLGMVYDELGSNNRCLGKINKSHYYYSKALKVKSFIGNKRGLDVTVNNILTLLIQIEFNKTESIEKADTLNFQQVLEEESL